MDDTAHPARPDTDEIAAPRQTAGVHLGGRSVHDRAAAWIDEIDLDPRGRHGRRGALRLFEAALTDARARAVLDQRIDAGVAAPLEIEPGGTMRRDRQAADDLREQLQALEIDRITREMLHAVWYGYAAAECLWRIDGARVALDDLRVRHPGVIRWDPDTMEPLLVTRSSPAGAPLPPAKFVLVANPRGHGGQPHGPGVAQWCIWPVWLKRMTVRSWAVALERFGTPVATARVQRDASAEEVERALAALASLASGTSLAIPEDIAIEILEANRRAGGDYEVFAREMDRMIASAVIGQHGTSEIGPHVGTGEVHMKVLERLVTADARRVCDALRRTVATWLTAWNHPGAAVPRLHRDTAPADDLESRARRDAALATASGLRPSRAYIEAVYGGEWEPASDPPASGPPARLAAPGADEAIDSAVEAIARGWEPLMGPVIAPVIEAAGRATSMDGLRDILDDPALHDAMDNGAFERRLARATFSARVSAAGEPEGEA